MLNCSPVAKADGTTEAPGWDSEGAWESSVSSECASIALAKAASIAPQTTSDAATVAVFSAEWARAKLIAKRPGARSAPETMAAKVSRMCCLVFSRASCGSGPVPASVIYELRRFITGLIDATAARNGSAMPEAAAEAAKDRRVIWFSLPSGQHPYYSRCTHTQA